MQKLLDKEGVANFPSNTNLKHHLFRFIISFQFKRYVPFAAVAAANCVNIPLMRQNEIVQGVDVQDENGNVIGKSRVAAVKGISQVVFSRIIMAAPGMLVLPVIMEKLERIPAFKKMTFMHAPFQTALVGCL